MVARPLSERRASPGRPLRWMATQARRGWTESRLQAGSPSTLEGWVRDGHQRLISDPPASKFEAQGPLRVPRPLITASANNYRVSELPAVEAVIAGAFTPSER